MAEAASASSDTLPKPGRVTEVCREWSVKEDGALAYRLQTEEIEQHYTGNKCRNAQVREDFPHALDEQRREQEEAARLYQQSILEQQELDARVAAELAQQINQEEDARKMALELEDQRMARKLQEKEHVRLVQKRLPQEINNSLPAFNPDMNCVGLPPPPDPLAPQMRLCSINDITLPPNETVQVVDDVSNPSRSCETSLCDAEDEESRRIQEEQDAELARLLQERESIPQLSALDRDRLIALEAQDRELARLLQERERAKARRARERAKQRALLKKQQQEGGEAVDELGASPMPIQKQPVAVRPTHLDLSGASSKSRTRMRYTDPEAIEVLSPDVSNGTRSSPPPNIAMAIDPTYKGVGSPVSSLISSPLSLPPPDFDDLDDSPVPPYMPIQGQRRCTSLEKKGKKSSLGSGIGSTGRNRKDGGKDGCKQQ